MSDFLKTVEEHIKTPVPTELGELLELIQQLTEDLLEVGQQRVQNYQTYLVEHERMRHPKDKEYTDFDRTSMVNAAVAHLQASYQRCAVLETILKPRIELLSAIYLERIGYTDAVTE